MKKTLLIFTLFSAYVFSQVGINTSKPKTALDVEGNVRVGTIDVLTTKADYILTVDDNQELKKILVNSLTPAPPDPSLDIYSPKLAGMFRFTGGSGKDGIEEKPKDPGLISCSSGCTKKRIIFDDSVTENKKFIKNNSNGTFTILADGLYKITLQVGFRSLQIANEATIGILNSSNAWLSSGSFSVPTNTGGTSGPGNRHFKVLTVVLPFVKEEIFSIGATISGAASVSDTVIQGVQTGGTGDGNVTNITIVKY